jgi:hypothetical protein
MPAGAFADGAEVEVTCAGGTFRLPVHIRPELPPGVAGLSAGVPPLPGSDCPRGERSRGRNDQSLPDPLHRRHCDRGADIAALLIWVERRLLALWQDRYGPNRVGPFGLLQVAADAIKMFMKEDWIPPFVDKPVFMWRRPSSS